MSAKWEEEGTNDGVLTFPIEQAVIEKGLTQAFNKVKKNLNVPGFRKGRVSRTVFNRMYGEETLYEDALNAVSPEAYEAAVLEAGIEPVVQPKIDIESMNKGGDWAITAEVAVKPEVKLGEYRNLAVSKQDREVTDEDVGARLKRKRESQVELVIKEDAAAKNGDTVVINFEGFLDDEALEGGKGENYSLELGSNSFILGFENQLVGKKAGEEVEVDVTFPEDYQAGDLVGKEAILKVAVHEVKAKELPELDDEFAKDVDDSVESLDESREEFRKKLTEAKEAAAEEAKGEEAIRLAVGNAEIVELPHVMVHNEAYRSMDGLLNNIQRQEVPPEMYYRSTGSTEEDLRKQFEGEAETHTKTDLAIEAVAKTESIEVTQEDIDVEVKDLAEQYNIPEAQVRKVLNNDMLEHDIRMKRAVEIITEIAVEK